MIESLFGDVRYALRGLAANRLFSVVAIGSLALGIGLNSALFSVVNALLLRPLAVSNPDQLVRIYTTSEIPESTFSYPDLRDVQRETTVFSAIAAHTLMFANVSHEGQSQLLLGEIVTANYFDTLGVRAALGRVFDATEDRTEGGNRVALIADSLWRRQFGGDRTVLGRSLRVRGVDYTIVGVLPARFSGMTPGLKAELWVPISMVADVEPIGMNDIVVSPEGKTRLTQRGNRWMFVTARLAPGASLAQARAAVDSTMERLRHDYPQTNGDRHGVVRPAASVRIHPTIDNALLPGAAAIMIAVGLVLLVACANIANLLLARGSSRRREMAIRVAVGAGRVRLVRQLLAESFVLASLGGLAGLLLAAWSVRLVLGIQPALPIPITLDLSLDARVLGFTALVAMATGLLFGLAPALQATRTDLVPSLKDDAAALSGGGRMRLRGLLVVAQVTVCVVLLVGAALLTRGAMRAARVDIGFHPEGLAITTVDLAMHRYSADRGAVFYRDALDRVRAIPGVTSAALVERLPFSPNLHTRNLLVEGKTYPPDARGDLLDVTAVTSGYFRTLGVPVLQGRDFDNRDTEGSPPVVIVNEAMARKYWPGVSAVGRRIRAHGASAPFEVVGVVRDYKVRTVGESPVPFVHFARAQRYAPSVSILARTTGDAADLARAMRRALLSLEPELVFIENQPMETAIATTLFPVRAGAALGAGFGVLALLLAAIGLYGVTAFWVSRRTREIGIRIALGATPRAVIARVLAQGLMLVLCGLIAGGLLAIAATRSLVGMLYGVSSIDPISYAAATAVLLAVALAANIIPARRAARVDPMIALRTT